MLKKVVRKQKNSENCFACGRLNNAGLKMDFYEMEDDTLVALVTADARHQSYPGTVHGGISATMLDETIGRAMMCINEDVVGTTLEFTSKYKKPVPYGVQLIVTGRVVEEREKVFIAEGEIILPDGSVAATATGVYYKMDTATAEKFGADVREWDLYPTEDDPTEINIPEVLVRKTQ